MISLPSCHGLPQALHLSVRRLATLTAVTSIALLLLGQPARAQLTDASVARSSYDFGLHTGPILPAGIRFVRQIVPAWGLRGSVPTPKGVFEADVLIGKGRGTDWFSGSLDYRLDIENDYLPVHFLLGLHADYYKPSRRDWVFAGGWHYGGGITEQLAGPILFRADFKYRYGPGQSLYVGIGFVYRLPSSGAGGQ